jgi:hypothetical protein
MAERTPWAFYSTADKLVGIAPAPLAAMARAKRRKEAEEARKQAERHERAEERMARSTLPARQHALARGLEWNPDRPFEHMPSALTRPS